MKELGQVISNIRRQKKIAQGKLASSIGISQNYLSMIEKNKREPTLQTLKAIAEKLGVPYQVIIFLTLSNDDIPDSKKYKVEILDAIKMSIQNMYLDD